MKSVEKIYLGEKLIAIIFRSSVKVDGVKFFTDEFNPFQVGFHNRKKGVKLAPHIHKIEKPLIISTIQEILYVQSCNIRIKLYTKKGQAICSKILAKEDSVLIMEIGHSVNILEDSKIFQVKQGPYPGTEHAKIYLKDVKS